MVCCFHLKVFAIINIIIKLLAMFAVSFTTIKMISNLLP